jgi:hypothetical protein
MSGPVYHAMTPGPFAAAADPKSPHPTDVAGKIGGTTTTGVALGDPATQNPTTLATGGYITNNPPAPAYDGDAVYGGPEAAWDFANYGIVKSNATSGSGVYLAAGGTVTKLSEH